MSDQPALRLGTRSSALARWQAEWTAGRLVEAGIRVELVLITTQGDARAGPIGALGTQGVFTREIQRALLDHRVDLAVHSLKDLPTEPIDGLCLAAVPLRESVCDVLVARKGMDGESLPEGARVGTGSLRRRAQLLYVRRDLRMLDIRGNVDTRLRQLDEGRYDAVVLAEAGLKRLGLDGRVSHVLPPARMLPAVGQGALGLETRSDDDASRRWVERLNHADTHCSVLAERALLAALRGGCLAPIAAWGRVVDGRLQLDAAVLDGQGGQRLSARIEGPPSEAVRLGQQAAQQLLDQGAGELIAAARGGGGAH